MNTDTCCNTRSDTSQRTRRARTLFTALAALGAWHAACAVTLADPVLGGAIQLYGSASSGTSSAQMGGVQTSSLATGQQVLDYVPSGILASAGEAHGGTTAWLVSQPSVSSYGMMIADPLGNGFGPWPGGSPLAGGVTNYGDYEANAGSHITYQFAIGGPFGTVNLAVAAQVQAVVSTQPFQSAAPYHTYAGANAYVQVSSNGTSTLFDFIQASNQSGTSLSRTWIDTSGVSHSTQTDNGGSGNYNESGTYQFQTNTVYTVTINAGCDVTGQFGPQYGASGSCSALADPVFTIDPSTPNAGAYQLQFSSGVGNTAAVPEPSRAWLFATGLAALGVAWRRGRARRQP